MAALRYTEADRQESAAARQQAARAQSQMQYVLRFARDHGITGMAAQRFLARQRASLRRRQQWEALAQALALQPAHLVAHCGRWHLLAQIPYTLPCCGRQIFQEGGR